MLFYVASENSGSNLRIICPIPDFLRLLPHITITNTDLINFINKNLDKKILLPKRTDGNYDGLATTDITVEQYTDLEQQKSSAWLSAVNSLREIMKNKFENIIHFMHLSLVLLEKGVYPTESNYKTLTYPTDFTAEEVSFFQSCFEDSIYFKNVLSAYQKFHESIEVAETSTDISNALQTFMNSIQGS